MSTELQRVLFYAGPNYMFSNFSSFVVEWRGVLWYTSEHAYQAAKFTDPDLVSLIQNARSAHDAKRIARFHEDKMRADWDEIKISVMEEIIRQKLRQHPFIQKKLIETGDNQMVEDSPTDSFWGRGPDWNGQNNLGKIWMRLREELKQASQAEPKSKMNLGGGGGN